MIKNLQLITSAIIVIATGFIYGFNPSEILPVVFDFNVENLELKNIFRAMMGLYLFLGCFWILGVKNKRLWKSATISNVIFMGGLSFGRIISTIVDGFSPQYFFGLVLELLFMIWGIYNLKTYYKTVK